MATRRARPASEVQTPCGEAVLGVVGEGHGLVLGAEGLDGEDRPEDLLADDAHLAVAVVEDGRLVEVAVLGALRGRLGALAAGAQHRALLEGGLDVHLDLGALLLGDQRAALDTVLGAASEADLLGAAGQFGDEAVPDRLLDDEAGAGRADLAAVDEAGVEGLVDGGVEALVGGAGVGEDDVGVLAAELEGDLLDAGRGGLRDLGAADQTAGEGDQVDVGVLGEPRTDRVAGPGDDVGDDAAGSPASTSSSMTAMVVIGVISLGLMTKVLPAASAGAIFQLA